MQGCGRSTSKQCLMEVLPAAESSLNICQGMEVHQRFMIFTFFIWIAENAARADNEVSQNTSDTGRATEGRSIGHVRDQSAPTGVRVSLFIFIFTSYSRTKFATINKRRSIRQRIVLRGENA